MPRCMRALAAWRHAAKSSGVDHVKMSCNMAEDTMISFTAIFSKYRTIWLMLCSSLSNGRHNIK